MTAIQTIVFFAIIALAAMAVAAPATRPQPFTLPASYMTGGLGSMWINFYEDGSFVTGRALPPSVCDNKPVCPELGGKGTWSYAPTSRQITLVQRIAADWTVTQVWEKGPESRDIDSSILRTTFVRATGKRSNEFPLPRGAVNWRRTSA